MNTESELVEHFRATCFMCEGKLTRPVWYLLCPGHARVARVVLFPEYEASLVRRKFYHLNMLGRLRGTLAARSGDPEGKMDTEIVAALKGKRMGEVKAIVAKEEAQAAHYSHVLDMVAYGRLELLETEERVAA